MARGEVREKYRELSRGELLESAYELGKNYEMHSFGCSQCTVAALHNLLDIDDVIVKVATSLCGGSAVQLIGSCGALTGGLLVLDYYFGREPDRLSEIRYTQSTVDALFSAIAVSQLLANRFIEEYGTTLCGQIQRQVLGRMYCVTDEEENRKFEEVGAHSDPRKCPDVVGNAAEWVMEILIDKGCIKV